MVGMTPIIVKLRPFNLQSFADTTGIRSESPLPELITEYNLPATGLVLIGKENPAEPRLSFRRLEKSCRDMGASDRLRNTVRIVLKVVHPIACRRWLVVGPATAGHR